MKKIAVFSDIHGNFQALTSIMNDIRNNDFDEVICLGDVVGLGPDSSKCLDKIMKSRVNMLLGNHELYQIYGTDIDELHSEVVQHEEWVNSTLNDEMLRYLKERKLQYEVLDSGKLLSFSHFFIKDGKEKYPFYPFSILDSDKLNSYVDNVSCDYFFFGHEHNGFTFYDGKSICSCVGSSGCNNKDITFYTIIEMNNGTIKISKKYLEYDRRKFERKMKNTLYPACDTMAKKFFGIEV